MMVEIYLQKARAKQRMLERSAEGLLPEARASAVEVLAELSLALSMLEGQQPSRSMRPEAAASMKLREEMMIELMKETPSTPSVDKIHHARTATDSSVARRRSAFGNLMNLLSGIRRVSNGTSSEQKGYIRLDHRATIIHCTFNQHSQ